MQLTIEKKNVGLFRLYYKDSQEFAVDSVNVLPDYLLQVLRVLNSDADVFITGRQITGNKINIEGTVKFKATYVSEEGGLGVTTQNALFRRTLDVTVPPDAAVLVTPYVSDVTARPTGPRKIDFFADVKLDVSVVGRENVMLPLVIDNDTTQQKGSETEYIEFVGAVERQYAVSDDLTLDSSAPTILRLLDSSLTVVSEEHKTVTGKIVLRSDLELSVSYVSDVTEGIPETASFTIPVNRVLDTEVESGDDAEVIVSVSSYTLTEKEDENGNVRGLSLDAVITVQAVVTRKNSTGFLSDAYDLAFNSTATLEQVMLPTNVTVYPIAATGTAVIEHGSEDISSVTGCSARLTGMDVSYNGEQKAFNCTAVCSVSYIDGNGELDFAGLRMDISEPLDANDACSPVYIRLTGSACSVTTGAEGFGVRLDVSAEVTEFCSSACTVISDFTIDEDSPASPPQTALVLCYGCAGEEIWEIAKSYNTSADSIKSLNGIDYDVLEQPVLLLIPTI